MKSRNPSAALVTVDAIDGPPSMADAARQIGAAICDLITEFGVVPIDPKRGLYCVEVIANRLPADFELRHPFHGPFSNAEISALNAGASEHKCES